jgi:uncharacterized protein YjbJ (UPF0337 family)
MKSSARDNAEGRLHQLKGKIKSAIGNMAGDRELKAEGKREHSDGKVQEKVGQIKKVLDK